MKPAPPVGCDRAARRPPGSRLPVLPRAGHPGRAVPADATISTHKETKVGTRPLGGLRRTDLGHGAWIDVLPQWLRGAAAAGANITVSGSGYNTGQGVQRVGA